MHLAVPLVDGEEADWGLGSGPYSVYPGSLKGRCATNAALPGKTTASRALPETIEYQKVLQVIFKNLS